MDELHLSMNCLSILESVHMYLDGVHPWMSLVLEAMLWFLGASRLAIITSISKSYLILRFRLYGQKWCFATVCITTSMVSFVLLLSPLPKEQKMAEVCAINYSVCWKPLPIKTSLCFIRKQLLGDPRSSCKNYDSWTHCLVRIICPVIPKVAFLGGIKTWGKLSALPTFFWPCHFRN